MSNTDIKVAAIGLGLMGSSIARNTAKSGFGLRVYDVDSSIAAAMAGGNITAVANPAEAGADADVVLLSLPGPPEVRGVCTGRNGLIETMKPNSVIVDLSTNAVQVVAELATILATKRIAFLDAPVSGGPWGAADGTLAIWVGGQKEAFNQVLPVLHSIGKAVEYMGPIGTGTITKLVHNTGANIRQYMLAEIMNLGIKAGIEPLALFKAIREGSNGRARTFDGIGGKYLDQTYDQPAFRLKHAQKDLQLAIELGAELDVPMDLAELVMARMNEAMAMGWGDRDSSVVGLLAEKAAGIKFPAVDRALLKSILA